MQEHGAGPALSSAASRRTTSGRAAIIGVAAAALVVVDQVTKWWAQRALDDRDIDLFWTLRLHLEYNTGSAFSLGAGRGGLIALGAIAVVMVMLWVGRAVHDPISATALGLVLGGAVGNLLDRAFRHGSGFFGGGVVDFIDLQWWPVFNVADMAITIGGALLVLAATRAPEPEAGAEAQADVPDL